MFCKYSRRSPGNPQRAWGRRRHIFVSQSVTYPNRVPRRMLAITCRILLFFILLGLVLHPRRTPNQVSRTLQACPCCALFCPAVTPPDMAPRRLVAIPCRILFFFILLGLVRRPPCIPGQVPCPLQACPCRALFCARCVERVLSRACFLEFFVRSVKFRRRPAKFL